MQKTTMQKTSWDDERLARAALSHACEGGSQKLAAFLDAEGAVALWQALRRSGQDSAWPRRARLLDVAQLVARSEAAGVRFVVPGDDEWPSCLDVLDGVEVAGLGGRPVGLWLRGPGRLDQLTTRAVALVGSRASSPYGDQAASELAADLCGPGPLNEPSAGGWTIVSGGAYGIDACSHRAAMAAEGHTLAVLAGGLDEPYPRGNWAMFEQILAEHLLVSEVPVGIRPTRLAFLARNRLIAALGQGTVLVEAGARSGANNTANWTLECGRVLMAVPGSIFSANSVGCHRLVRDGRATLVQGARDVAALLAPLGQAPLPLVGGEQRRFDQVDPALMAVREVLPGRGAMPVGEVAARAGRSIPATLASLGQLERLGLAAADQTGQWRLASPTAVPAGRT